VDEVRAVGDEIGATPARVALAWLLAQGIDVVPVPGTRRVARVEENTAADAVVLTSKQLSRLGRMIPAIGARHDDASMASIDRRRGRRAGRGPAGLINDRICRAGMCRPPHGSFACRTNGPVDLAHKLR
jgi:Aldo/keto reductase family